MKYKTGKEADSLISLFIISIIPYRENDGTGGGQKNGKLILYYGGKYYLDKVVNGENYLYNVYSFWGVQPLLFWWASSI